MFPSPLSPSPIHKAFVNIEWNDPISISQPELRLLTSAEENPLEYTLAVFDDVYLYVRLLLKLLDQVTGPSPTGTVSELSLIQKPLEDEEAQKYLETDKPGVIAHYLITRLYELILLLEEQQQKQPYVKQTKKDTSVVNLTTIFYKQDGTLMEDWMPLLRLLYRQGDAFAQRNAALSLAYILKTGTNEKNDNDETVVEETIQSLVSWITSRLQSSHSRADSSLSVVTPSLVVLASCPPARRILDAAGGIGYLTRHLRLFVTRSNNKNNNKDTTKTSTSRSAPPTIQQVYELCFSLWTMTYDLDSNTSIQQSFTRNGTIHALCQLLALAPREKVVRLTLATLRNLAEDTMVQEYPYTKTYRSEMIAAQAPKYIQQLQERSKTNFLQDPDLLQDLEILSRVLNNHAKELTQWNVYHAELESGQLAWGMLHTEQFFQQHILKMEGPKGDFEPVKKLLTLLMQNLHTIDDDNESLAVCLFDLGEFIRQYPNGRSIAKRLGIRDIVLKLLDHSNPEVQGHALKCVSKLLVQHNWRAVGSSIGS